MKLRLVLLGTLGFVGTSSTTATHPMTRRRIQLTQLKPQRLPVASEGRWSETLQPRL
jgi:hypothetical protein